MFQKTITRTGKKDRVEPVQVRGQKVLCSGVEDPQCHLLAFLQKRSFLWRKVRFGAAGALLVRLEKLQTF